MIRLNRMTDYAVVVLAQMACRPEDTVTAPQLAKATSMPLPTVSKMLKALARHDILRSLRGASGGYRLNGAPEDISVARIIAALEGPIALTACVDGAEGDCGVERLCPMRGNWDRVNEAIRGALEAVSLAEMSAEMMPFALGGPDGEAAGRAEGAAA